MKHKIKHHLRKVLSLLLTVCLTAAISPAVVRAAGEVCAINGVQYATLDGALAAVADGQTITLLTDIDYNAGITIDDGRSITFDLAGHTLNITNSGGNGLTVTNGSVNYIGEGSLNVTGASFGINVNGADASATVTNATATYSGSYGVSSGNGGSVTIKQDARGGYAGVAAWGLQSTVAVWGDATGTGADSIGARAFSTGQITVNGNAQGQRYGAYASNGHISVKNNVSATGADNIGAFAENAGQIVIDGTITATSFVKAGSTIKTRNDYDADTTKVGYLTYSDGDSTVWVGQVGFTVAFDSQGGSDVQTKTAQYNTNITAPGNPTRAGYAFGGWYKEAGCVNPWNFSTDKVMADTTMYAKWIAQYTITANANNTSYGSVTGGGTYNSGSTATVRATPSSGYRFVRWLEGSNRVSTSAAYSFTVTKARTLEAEFAAIATPTLTASSAGYNSVKLSWTSVSGRTGYKLYRATSKTGTYSLVKTTALTSYTNTGLTTGKTYYYRVRAYCVADSTTTYGSYSSYKYARPVPAAPTSVKAARASSKSIKITWGAVSGASKYQVYRATTKTGTYSRVATTANRYFTNTGISTGKYYYYKVRAYHLEGSTKVYGSFSSVVYARPY